MTTPARAPCCTATMTARRSSGAGFVTPTPMISRCPQRPFCLMTFNLENKTKLPAHASMSGRGSPWGVDRGWVCLAIWLGLFSGASGFPPDGEVVAERITQNRPSDAPLPPGNTAGGAPAITNQVVLSLRGGDRISGVITAEDTSRVVVTTRWAREVVVPLAEILKRQLDRKSTRL